MPRSPLRAWTRCLYAGVLLSALCACGGSSSDDASADTGVPVTDTGGAGGSGGSGGTGGSAGSGGSGGNGGIGGSGGTGGSGNTADCRIAPDAVLVRNELVGGTPATGAQPLLRFAQMSDEHIMDDDGAATNGASFTDPIYPALDAAQRFQDEYTDEVMNAMIKTINGCHAVSPVELMIATGDNTDLGTVAEVRRFIDNLDGDFDRVGDFEKKCSARVPGPFVDQACTRFTGRGIADTQTVDPDIDDPSYQFLYSRMLRQLFDTEQAVVTGRGEDGSTDPARATLTRSPGMPQSLRCKSGPGCANLRLETPYYAVFGNHDGYARGTISTFAGIQEASLATGRHYMREQHEFIDEFFETAAVPGPVGHGFNHVELARMEDADGRNDGYYAFDAGNGRFRMIVMNTIIDGTDPRLPAELREAKNTFALSDGTVDAAQFNWIKAELAKAKTDGKLVMLFSHHPDLTFAEFGSFAPLLPSDPAFTSAANLNAELASYPNVIAWIAGHTHRHRIRAFKVSAGQGSNGVVQTPVTCKDPGSCTGFWQIETASLIDFPQEQRLFEVLDNGNGTGTIRARVLQHDYENSKRLADKDDQCQFYFTDPAAMQEAITDADMSAICKQGGTRDGEPTDRNVDLMFRMP